MKAGVGFAIVSVAFVAVVAPAAAATPEDAPRNATESRLLRLMDAVLGGGEGGGGDDFGGDFGEWEPDSEHNLTQLLIGERLMAQAHGEVLLAHPDALNKMRIAGLRAEAVRRLSYRPPSPEYRPTAILSLSEAHKYVLMVDASRSRIYLFENRDGEPHLIDSYYTSVGKAGMGKLRRGDNRTPVGVYRSVKWLADGDLDELYGFGAYVLNYPNDWDRLHGRTGSGIWLHGTPRDLHNRPPLSSRGCIVINNARLERLRERIGEPTAVVLTARSYWVPAEDWRLVREALHARIERWRTDWESMDTERYLAHYAADYREAKRDRETMAESVRRHAKKKSRIEVAVENVDLFAYPGEDRRVFAVFDQDYRSNNYKTSYRKQQMWREEDGELKLVYEGRWE